MVRRWWVKNFKKEEMDSLSEDQIIDEMLKHHQLFVGFSASLGLLLWISILGILHSLNDFGSLVSWVITDCIFIPMLSYYLLFYRRQYKYLRAKLRVFATNNQQGTARKT